MSHLPVRTVRVHGLAFRLSLWNPPKMRVHFFAQAMTHTSKYFSYVYHATVTAKENTVRVLYGTTVNPREET